MNNVNINIIENFPTLPTVYTAILSKIQDPKTTAKDISDLLISDQATTIKLLSLVNSSIFSFRKKITTISEAVTFLGFNEVRDTILTLAVMNMMKLFRYNKNFNVIELWKHSIAVGIISKIIAKKLNLENNEELFISGILHDIGKLALYNSYKNTYVDLIKNSSENNLSLLIEEKKMFSLNHSEIGSLLAKKWNLSKVITDTIEYHHSKNIEQYENSPAIACIYLANQIANLIWNFNTASDIFEKPSNSIWEILGINKGFFNKIKDEILITYEDSLNILKIN
mgnify:CR=1 FL=1